MDAILSNAADVGYSDLPPALIFGTSDAAIGRAERSVRASGLRIGTTLPIEQAQLRLDAQGLASAIWLEIDRDCGGPLDALLSRIAGDVRDGRYAAVVSTTADVIDILAAQVDEPRVEILVNGDDPQRTGALATALASQLMPSRTEAVAGDKNADPHDGRRVFVELAPETSNALRRYFAEVGQVAVV